MKLQFVIVERACKRRCEFALLTDFLIHGCFIEADLARRIDLGAIHGEVGIIAQRVAVFAVIRIDRDANTATKFQVRAFMFDRCLKRPFQLFQIGIQNRAGFEDFCRRKLIAAETRSPRWSATGPVSMYHDMGANTTG